MAAAVMALLVGAAVAAIAAAVTGAALATGRAVLLGAVALTVTSLLLQSSLGVSVGSMANAHLVLAASLLAIGSVGRLCATCFANRLDAIGTSLLVAVAFTGGVLLLGQLAGDLPPAVLNIVLALNPVVASASAANIDVVRLPLFYDLSPVAHRAFSYPTLAGALTLHLGIATAAFLAHAVASRRGGAAAPALAR